MLSHLHAEVSVSCASLAEASQASVVSDLLAQSCSAHPEILVSLCCLAYENG